MRRPAHFQTPAALALALAVGLGAGCGRPAAPPSQAHRRPDVDLPRETESIAGRVPDRTTLSALLLSLQLRPDLVPAIVSATRTVFDPRRLRADHTYRLERTFGGLLRRFDYEIDEDRFLRLAGAADDQPGEITAEVVPYQKETKQVSVVGEITKESPSLFEAMDRAGEGPDLSIELADIFSGEIDFNSDLQAGDRFSLTFEKVYREGKFSSYGPVLAAELSNEGRVLKAFRFTLPGGQTGYYDENGRSLKRFFLKSPLKFAARVTSRFSRARMHPILRILRPHLGVDYGAPTGSPVVAVANGVVVSAGWAGQGGRMVRLRHASGYQTFYMHLSSIAVRAGHRVSQGDLIGRVGMSGLATGPHLDYRVWKNGVPINPLTLLRSLPPGEPIPRRLMAQFSAERDRMLSSLSPPAPANTAPAAAPGAGK